MRPTTVGLVVSGAIATAGGALGAYEAITSPDIPTRLYTVFGWLGIALPPPDDPAGVMLVETILLPLFNLPVWIAIVALGALLGASCAILRIVGWANRQLPVEIAGQDIRRN